MSPPSRLPPPQEVQVQPGRWAAQTPHLSAEMGPLEAFKCCQCGDKGASRDHFLSFSTKGKTHKATAGQRTSLSAQLCPHLPSLQSHQILMVPSRKEHSPLPTLPSNPLAGFTWAGFGSSASRCAETHPQDEAKPPKMMSHFL